MSRIGKAPIDVPDKVDIAIEGNTVTVKGPLGQLSRTFRPEIEITQDGNVLFVKRRSENRMDRALHGLSRTLLSNMVMGVSKGFQKNLEMVGVGYRAQVQGSRLIMQLGFSHPIELDPPIGVQVVVESNTKIAITGYDKEAVGNFAAIVRRFRPPEPYKGKGVRYAGERVRRKAGKAGKK